ARSPSSSSRSSSASRASVRSARRLQPMPAANATVTAVAMASKTDAMNSAMPVSGAPKTLADARQRGDEGGGEEGGEDPQQAAPFLADRPVCQQPPAEQHFRQQQHDGGQA